MNNFNKQGLSQQEFDKIENMLLNDPILNALNDEFKNHSFMSLDEDNVENSTSSEKEEDAIQLELTPQEEFIFNQLSTLKENYVFKNYNELCNFLNIEIKINDAKKTQLANLKRFCDFQKVGYKFIINKIYPTPLLKTNNYSSPYTKLNEYIICELLIRHSQNFKDQDFVYSVNSLAKQIGYINELFTQYWNHRGKLSAEIDIDKSIINEFYTKVNNSYKRIIKTTFDKLKSERIAIIEEICYVRDIVLNEDNVIVYTTENEFGDEVDNYSASSTITHNNRPATKLERELIITVEQQVFSELSHTYNISITSKHDIFKYNKLKEFSTLRKKYFAEKIKISNYYMAYRISFVPEFIYKKQRSLVKEIKQINNLFIDKTMDNKNKDINKKLNNLSKATNVSDELKQDFVDLQDNTQKDFLQLCNKLLKIK